MLDQVMPNISRQLVQGVLNRIGIETINDDSLAGESQAGLRESGKGGGRAKEAAEGIGDEALNEAG